MAIKCTKAELKAELMQQAELLMDRVVDWADETERPTLAQIEDIVSKLRQQMGEGMAKAVIEAQRPERLGLRPNDRYRLGPGNRLRDDFLIGE